ncbi:hypothetical protein FCV25MIE_17389 [Fagus crenata]
MAGKYDHAKMELLVKVASQCMAENKDERPTMNQRNESQVELKLLIWQEGQLRLLKGVNATSVGVLIRDHQGHCISTCCERIAAGVTDKEANIDCYADYHNKMSKG